ncbi:hypothetical protein M0804_001650 [Polistes exclamans]|nr:hypothetical protein M0804_001650 [Polistes exclamans]
MVENVELLERKRRKKVLRIGHVSAVANETAADPKLRLELRSWSLIMDLNWFAGTYIEPNEQFRIRPIDLSNKLSRWFRDH